MCIQHCSQNSVYSPDCILQLVKGSIDLYGALYKKRLYGAELCVSVENFMKHCHSIEGFIESHM